MRYVEDGITILNERLRDIREDIVTPRFRRASWYATSVSAWSMSALFFVGTYLSAQEGHQSALSMGSLALGAASMGVLARHRASDIRVVDRDDSEPEFEVDIEDIAAVMDEVAINMGGEVAEKQEEQEYHKMEDGRMLPIYRPGIDPPPPAIRPGIEEEREAESLSSDSDSSLLVRAEAGVESEGARINMLRRRVGEGKGEAGISM